MLPPEIRRIWYTRNEEFEPETANWIEPFDCEDAHDTAVERADLLKKILRESRLTTRERMIVELHCVQDWTLQEIADSMHVTRSRIGQIFHLSLRRLRFGAREVTGESAYCFGYKAGEVLTWREWSWRQQDLRKYAKRAQS